MNKNPNVKKAYIVLSVCDIRSLLANAEADRDRLGKGDTHCIVLHPRVDFSPELLGKCGEGQINEQDMLREAREIGARASE